MRAENLVALDLLESVDSDIAVNSSCAVTMMYLEMLFY